MKMKVLAAGAAILIGASIFSAAFAAENIGQKKIHNTLRALQRAQMCETKEGYTPQFITGAFLCYSRDNNGMGDDFVSQERALKIVKEQYPKATYGDAFGISPQ